MDGGDIPESERRQIQQIRELDMEELQVEEVDEDFDDDDDDEYDLHAILQHAMVPRNDGGAGPSGGFTYNTCLTSLHTYLGEVDDTRCRFSFLEGGAVLKLPMFYLEGIVLFPEATLPLKVIQPRFLAAVEKALTSVDAPFIIGVVRVYHHSIGGRGRFSYTGTTAEIRQYKHLADGSYNVVARGQQRFRLRRRWVDDEGAPCGEVQIVQEDSPLTTPKDVSGQLASVSNSTDLFSLSCSAVSRVSKAKQHEHRYAANDLECTSSGSDISVTDMRVGSGATDSSDSLYGYDRSDEASSGDDRYMHKYVKKKGPLSESFRGYDQSTKHKTSSASKSLSVEELGLNVPRKSNFVPNNVKFAFRAPMAFWPPWVYKMYDSYSLAQRAADLWGKIVGKPNLGIYTRKPDILSFHIASKLPMSEATRQELLEIDGISYRLQREIQLLKGLNLVRCRNCQTLIAKRSDMVVMSTDGPLNAYVNPHGFVHEVITVGNATGLALLGSAVKEHSWFPGYAWTIANCAVCETNMGWLFTATNKNLLPKSFWGIRSCQVVDETSK